MKNIKLNWLIVPWNAGPIGVLVIEAYILSLTIIVCGILEFLGINIFPNHPGSILSMIMIVIGILGFATIVMLSNKAKPDQN